MAISPTSVEAPASGASNWAASSGAEESGPVRGGAIGSGAGAEAVVADDNANPDPVVVPVPVPVSICGFESESGGCEAISKAFPSEATGRTAIEGGTAGVGPEGSGNGAERGGTESDFNAITGAPDGKNPVGVPGARTGESGAAGLAGGAATESGGRGGFCDSAGGAVGGLSEGAPKEGTVAAAGAGAAPVAGKGRSAGAGADPEAGGEGTDGTEGIEVGRAGVPAGECKAGAIPACPLAGAERGNANGFSSGREGSGNPLTGGAGMKLEAGWVWV